MLNSTQIGKTMLKHAKTRLKKIIVIIVQLKAVDLCVCMRHRLSKHTRNFREILLSIRPGSKGIASRKAVRECLHDSVLVAHMLTVIHSSCLHAGLAFASHWEINIASPLLKMTSFWA